MNCSDRSDRLNPKKSASQNNQLICLLLVVLTPLGTGESLECLECSECLGTRVPLIHKNIVDFVLEHWKVVLHPDTPGGTLRI